MKFDCYHAKACNGLQEQSEAVYRIAERVKNAKLCNVGAELLMCLADQLAERSRWISDTSDVSITRVEIDAESDESVKIAGTWVQKARPRIIVHDSYEAARGYMEAMMECGAIRHGEIVVRDADEEAAK